MYSVQQKNFSLKITTSRNLDIMPLIFTTKEYKMKKILIAVASLIIIGIVIFVVLGQMSKTAEVLCLQDGELAECSNDMNRLPTFNWFKYSINYTVKITGHLLK